MAEVVAEGFDLTAELSVRPRLLVLGPRDHVLLVVLHHIVADGLSLAPLARDLGLAYTARAAGRPPVFAPMPVQYADYTLWQQSVLGREQEPGSPWPASSTTGRRRWRDFRKNSTCRRTGRARAN